MPCAPVCCAVASISCSIAAGEHHLVPRLAGQFDDGGADALAAAGDEKTSRLHDAAYGIRLDEMRYLTFGRPNAPDTLT